MSLTITNEDNMALMSRYPDNYFDLAIVDPPYGISVDDGMAKDSNTQRGKSASKRGVYVSKNWDKTTPEIQYFKELFRVSKNIIIWGANHFIQDIPNANSSSWIIWDKKKWR